MRQKACKHCGAVFETDRQGAYLCPACALEARRKSVFRDRICIDCGATFTGYPKSKRCPNCQADANRKRNKAFKRIGPKRLLGSTDICALCGGEYIVESGMQRYCKKCSAQAVAENVREHKRAYMQDNADAFRPAKEANRSYNKVCLICGKVFDTGNPSVTCSPACEAKLKTLRQNEADFRRGKRKLPPDVKYDSGLPKSGIVGVTARRNGRWQAAYKRHYIGVFDTISEAAAAIKKYKEDHPND